MRRAASTAAAVLTAAGALLPFLAAQPHVPTLETAVRPVQPRRAPIPAKPAPSHTPTPRANRFEDRPPLAEAARWSTPPSHAVRPTAAATSRASRPTLPRASATRSASPSTASRRYVDLGVWRVTKYCSTGNRTASDTWPAIGDAATLDRGIPFGTLLRIVGRDAADGRWIDQTFTVTDRIGHGSQLDLYAGGEGDPSCEPRVDRTWGRQYLRVLEVLPAR